MFDITAEKRALANRPESGMGYQVVQVRIKGDMYDRVEIGIAFNGELLVLEGEQPVLITRSNFRSLVQQAPVAAGRIKEIDVLTDHRGLRVLKSRARASLGFKGGPASEAPVEQTKEGEVFKRFSAYENDFRVRDDRSWSPGTYATTKEDAANVKTGTEAVRRYSLPNDAPASWLYTGKPNKGTAIQKGIVEPANGQPGGGVEVIFPDGTQAYTVTLPPDKIPD